MNILALFLSGLSYGQISVYSSFIPCYITKNKFERLKMLLITQTVNVNICLYTYFLCNAYYYDNVVQIVVGIV